MHFSKILDCQNKIQKVVRKGIGTLKERQRDEVMEKDTYI